MNPEFGTVITAMVTPFDERGQIDEGATEGLIKHLLANGTDGLVVCGTTGESPTLSHAEKLKLFGLVKEITGGRVPLIAGTGSNNTAESITLSKEAVALGYDAVLLVAPYYNRPSQEGLYRHFRTIAEAARTPTLLYNIPGRSAVTIEPATIKRLVKDCSFICGVKEATGNLMQASELLIGAPGGFLLYSGEDGLVLPLMAIGGVGVISVTSHLVGRDLSAMCSAYRNGAVAEAARLHLKMMPIVRACFQSTTPSPAPVKAALNLIGVPVGEVRLPLVPVNDSERQIVQKAVYEYGLLGEKVRN